MSHTFCISQQISSKICAYAYYIIGYYILFRKLSYSMSHTFCISQQISSKICVYAYYVKGYYILLRKLSNSMFHNCCISEQISSKICVCILYNRLYILLRKLSYSMSHNFCTSQQIPSKFCVYAYYIIGYINCHILHIVKKTVLLWKQISCNPWKGNFDSLNLTTESCGGTQHNQKNLDAVLKELRGSPKKVASWLVLAVCATETLLVGFFVVVF